jgi:hypothetical protein
MHTIQHLADNGFGQVDVVLTRSVDVFQGLEQEELADIVQQPRQKGFLREAAVAV